MPFSHEYFSGWLHPTFDYADIIRIAGISCRCRRMYEEALKLDEDVAETSEGLRIGRDLIKATVPFAEKSVMTSWWYVGTTFAMLVAARDSRPGGPCDYCSRCLRPCRWYAPSLPTMTTCTGRSWCGRVLPGSCSGFIRHWR
jgi:hypothetical protein